ncbi:hypothetical protein F4818DRAFT_416188 [Hypoxylon cercidicola]|nr:hypothetical protein F4818DRAFT_416188 [Hypoxylon cercidicola]
MYRDRPSNSHSGPWRSPTPWRGGTRNRGQSSDPKSEVPMPLHGLLIAVISADDLSNDNIQADDVKISNVKYAASYSLVDRHSSKIIIPGQPATWNPPQLPTQLPPDYGEYLRDHNGARFKHPMQPTVQSLFALNKAFDAASVDIMGCASSLGDILRFARSVESTFRFDVEMVGNTLFIVRNHHNEVIPDVRGYGHSFLDAFTSHEAEMKKTESHQRVISYSFGGLKCLLRFECDGYFADKEGNLGETARELKDLNLPPTPTSNLIRSEKSGKAVSQESILEIKTRSETKGPLDMSEQLPRLWLRQIPHLVEAYHFRGKFADVQPRAVKQDVHRWEAEHEAELQAFAWTLRRLIVEVKRASHLKLELCRTGLGPLELREQVGVHREALPAYWRDRWTGEYRQEPDGDDNSRPSDECAYSDECPGLSQSGGSSDEESSYDDDGDGFTLDYEACDFATCGYCDHCV